MSTTNGIVAKSQPSQYTRDKQDLVCGSGGSRAILGSAGAIFAISKAGFNNWRSIGGISGGSVPTLFFAYGMPVGKIVKLAVDVDFSSLLSRRTNILLTFMAFLLKDRLAQTRPRKAVLGSEKLGEFIDGQVPVWPEKYWTMAVAGKTQVLFTSKGVFQYLHDGTVRQLSAVPAPLGVAVRASCAVPGIIEPALYKGVYLFDGALSWDGQCPVGVVIKHFGSDPTKIIACDVGDRQPNGWENFVNNFWRVFCGYHCVWPADEKDPALWQAEGAVLVSPSVTQFPSLQFTLTSEQKWDAVMAGYTAAVAELWQVGLISNEKLSELAVLAMDQDRFKAACESAS